MSDDINWNRFKNMQEKRMKKKMTKDAKGKTSHDTEHETLTIQRLSAEVSGKAQKYSRVGAREFVPFQDYEDLSINNIKRACMKHFDMPATMCCDVLAGEQGPSCSSVKQIPDHKVIHVRFVECGDVGDARDPDIVTETSPKRRKTLNPVSSPQKPVNINLLESKLVPRSLSVVDMVKLGKVITNNTSSVKLQSFDMKGMVWSSERNVPFIIDTEPFGSGAFREAFKASSCDSEFKDN